MWQYAVVTNIDADHYQRVCRQWQYDGWSLEESNHSLVTVRQGIGSSGVGVDARWDLVFRKPGGPNLAEVHMESARTKLRDVRDTLMGVQSGTLRDSAIPMVIADIDNFLFKGSAGDM